MQRKSLRSGTWIGLRWQQEVEQAGVYRPRGGAVWVCLQWSEHGKSIINTKSGWGQHAP